MLLSSMRVHFVIILSDRGDSFGSKGFSVKKQFAYFLLLVYLAASGSRLRAQASGTIAGAVVDTADAAVPTALVTAIDERTNLQRTAITSTRGAFLFNSLRPGVYTITVEAQGFQKYVRQHVELLADQTLTVDARLLIGQLSETVTVEGTPPQ